MKSNIQPAEGKLGILIPGLGAVATTLIAGVEAVDDAAHLTGIGHGRQDGHERGGALLG